MKTRICLVVFFISLIFISSPDLFSQPWKNGRLKVSDNGHFIVHENGQPFFFQGCTAWWLLSKLSREDVDYYLSTRAKQGFNVIMFTAGNGFARDVNDQNYYGQKPFLDDNTLTVRQIPGDNNDWWDHLIWVIKRAEQHGLYVALTPAFNPNYNEFDTRQECESHALFLAALLKNQPNIIWVGGGDAEGSYGYSNYNERIMEIIDSLDQEHLITFHPYGPGQSSTHYHEKPWLDFNGIQTGHFRRHDPKMYTFPYSDWNLTPAKPVIDIEFAYENHPVRQQEGRFNASDIREKAYWSVFAGSCGLGYGHLNLWMFNTDASESEPHWKDAINAEGAKQLVHLKELLYSQDYTDRIPDFGLVENTGFGKDHVVGTRGEDYAFIYIPSGNAINVIMGKISGRRVNASWFNPRDGSKTFIGTCKNSGKQEFTPPAGDEGNKDYVLILESKN